MNQIISWGGLFYASFYQEASEIQLSIMRYKWLWIWKYISVLRLEAETRFYIYIYIYIYIYNRVSHILNEILGSVKDKYLYYTINNIQFLSYQLYFLNAITWDRN